MVLTPHQRSVAEPFLDAREAERAHIVVALSGAHAYGFPSPDSDLDLKAIHVDATRRRLGLAPEARPRTERLEVIEGVELDYSSNEVGPVLAGILNGNGNYVERVLGPHLLRKSEWLDSLAPLVQRNLSRRLHHHYRGFAHNQRKMAEKKPTAKKVLYVLRTSLTGTHALRTGELVTDLVALAPIYGVAIDELLAIKRSGEQATLPDLTRWQDEMDRAFARLDAALGDSVLPEEPPAADALDGWLVALRKSLI